MKRAAGMIIVCLVVTGLFAQGCASPVLASYERPARVNMAGFERVTLEAIPGDGGDAVLSRLKQALHVSGKFEVLDRENLKTIRRERELGDNGASSDGREQVTSASAAIKGRFLRHNFSTHIEEGTGQRGRQQYRIYKSVGTAEVEMGFEVIDLATSKLHVATTTPAKNQVESAWYPYPPGNLDPSGAYAACYDDVVTRFMRDMAPYTVTVALKMPNVNDTPSAAMGIAMFKVGQYGQAAEHFESALREAQALPDLSPRDRSRLHHYLGLSREFQGTEDSYALAVEQYNKAISVQPDEAVAKSLARCRERQRDVERFRDQGINPPQASN